MNPAPLIGLVLWLLSRRKQGGAEKPEATDERAGIMDPRPLQVISTVVASAGWLVIFVVVSTQMQTGRRLPGPAVLGLLAAAGCCILPRWWLVREFLVPRGWIGPAGWVAATQGLVRRYHQGLWPVCAQYLALMSAQRNGRLTAHQAEGWQRRIGAELDARLDACIQQHAYVSPASLLAEALRLRVSGQVEASNTALENVLRTEWMVGSRRARAVAAEILAAQAANAGAWTTVVMLCRRSGVPWTRRLALLHAVARCVNGGGRLSRSRMYWVWLLAPGRRRTVALVRAARTAAGAPEVVRVNLATAHERMFREPGTVDWKSFVATVDGWQTVFDRYRSESVRPGDQPEASPAPVLNDVGTQIAVEMTTCMADIAVVAPEYPFELPALIEPLLESMNSRIFRETDDLVTRLLHQCEAPAPSPGREMAVAAAALWNQVFAIRRAVARFSGWSNNPFRLFFDDAGGRLEDAAIRLANVFKYHVLAHAMFAWLARFGFGVGAEELAGHYWENARRTGFGQTPRLLWMRDVEMMQWRTLGATMLKVALPLAFGVLAGAWWLTRDGWRSAMAVCIVLMAVSHGAWFRATTRSSGTLMTLWTVPLVVCGVRLQGGLAVFMLIVAWLVWLLLRTVFASTGWLRSPAAALVAVACVSGLSLYGAAVFWLATATLFGGAALAMRLGVWRDAGGWLAVGGRLNVSVWFGALAVPLYLSDLVLAASMERWW